MFEKLDISRYLELRGKALIRIEKLDNGYFEFFVARFDEITGDKREHSIGVVSKKDIQDHEAGIDAVVLNFKENIRALLTDLDNLGPTK